MEHEEILENPSKIWRWLYTNRIWLLVFGLVVIGGFYMGLLLFGNNSVEVLLRLRAQKVHLIEEAQIIELQNARLQKQIFDLKGANLEK